jgi:hypothetical protein
MMRFAGLLILLAFVAQGRPSPGKVNSVYDKTASFAGLKTYSWVAGQPAFDPAVHKVIVATIDAEMSGLGLKKAEGGTGDVTIRYLAVRSTSVDLDKLEALTKEGGDLTGANYTVGRLIIVLEDAKSTRRLWAADSIERVDPAPAVRDETVKRVVGRMFETYPTRVKPR